MHSADCMKRADPAEMNNNPPFPVQQYLEEVYGRFLPLTAGNVASYIPELANADPARFGICIAAVDGHVYEVGDTRHCFTIQSISKAITYGLALEDNGIDAVLRKVDVEPSGEAFNSISLHPVSGRPRNPMINAGAIATCGMIEGENLAARWERLMRVFARYIGREPVVDERVFRSERETGHRNRALAHLMYGFGILEERPEDVLDLYFRQCSIDVTCRDLALIGACLANAGVNPVTGEAALHRDYVPRVLSVMSSCGMYDASGAWLFKVGMPAKSGVGGGIVAVLPGQIGIGVYSPALDDQGNSVRGVAVCEAISRDFNLHLFKPIRTTSSAVIRTSYCANEIGSRRARGDADAALLSQRGAAIRVYQLQGELVFGSTESLLRELTASIAGADYFVIDFKHVSYTSSAAAALFATFIRQLRAADKVALITETRGKAQFVALLRELCGAGGEGYLFDFQDSDHAIEWCEDRILERFGAGKAHHLEATCEDLATHRLTAGLSASQADRLRRAARRIDFAAGSVIVSMGNEAGSIFLIVAGEVEVYLEVNGSFEKRLTTLGPGMSFGEMAMVNRERRTANVRAIADTTCYEVGFAGLDDALRSTLLINLARQLSEKLLRAEREMQLLGD
jgi:glutaminase